MPISESVRQNMENASWIRRMFEHGALLKKKFGEEKVIDLSLGNPIAEPPAEFFSELERLAMERTKGAHRYMANAGFIKARNSVAEYLSGETGLDFTPECVIMTCGAAGGLNVALKAIADPGDELIIVAPFFPEYLFYAGNFGVRPVIAETGDDFQPDIAAIERAVTKRTRAIIVNSPNNPTGAVYGEEFYRSANQLLLNKGREHGRPIYLITDDPYMKLAYDGIKPPRAFSFVKNSIGVTSYSKELAIPGERIGYLSINPNCEYRKELFNGAVFCNRTLGFVNAPAMAQRLVANLASVSVDINDYQDKRDFLYNALKDIGYDIIKPQGAFYLFPRSPVSDDVRFVKLLQEKKILTVPGEGFGRQGHFRIAFCVSWDIIKRSVDGFKQAFKEA